MKLVDRQLDLVLSLAKDGYALHAVRLQVQHGGGVCRERRFARNAIAAPLPLGRGREAKTYGRVCRGLFVLDLEGAAVSHSAELVRGDFAARDSKAPSSGPSCRRRVFDTTGHLLPKRRRGVAPAAGEAAS
jgi:hypothetical protein